MTYTCLSNREIYCDLNRNELGECLGMYANIDQLQKKLFTGKKNYVLQISENSQEKSRGGVLI